MQSFDYLSVATKFLKRLQDLPKKGSLEQIDLIRLLNKYLSLEFPMLKNPIREPQIIISDRFDMLKNIKWTHYGLVGCCQISGGIVKFTTSGFWQLRTNMLRMTAKDHLV